MTPEQFEHYVAKIYDDKGYKTQVSPLSNDWGIDVIAVKGKEKIGIQVKMYGGTSRSVNRRVMMELYGAAAYQDCTSMVLATDGNVLSDALQVANKLGIEVLFIAPQELMEDYGLINDSEENESDVSQHKLRNSYPSFAEAWDKYIKPLKGKTITSGTLTNKIIDVSNASIKRCSSSGNSRNIDIEGFRLAYNVLLSKGYVSRDYINQQVDKRCSSGIVLILGQIPFVEITSNPKGLKVK